MKTRIFYVVMALVLTVALAVPLVGLGAPPAQAAGEPAFGDVETAVKGSSSADPQELTIAVPGGTSDGDLLIAVVTTDGSTTITPPAGWTEIDHGVTPDGTPAATLGVWYRIASSEPSNYTFSWCTSGCGGGNEQPEQQAVGAILQYTGVDTSNPIDDSDYNTGDSDNPTAPSVTTTVANTRILRIYGCDSDEDHGSPYPAGHTGRFNEESASSSACTSGAADTTQGAAGATGTAAFDLYGSGDQEWRAVTVAIAPPPPGTIILTPETDTNCVGGNHTVTATIVGYTSGTQVTFDVTSGPNSAIPLGYVNTEASGMASWTYTGDGVAGTDTIDASYMSVNPGTIITSDPVTKTWVADPGKPNTQLVMMLDGSSSVGSSNFNDKILPGLADAVGNVSCVPQDGSVQLTVIQFSLGSVLEIGPVTINASNAESIANAIKAITHQNGGGTCIDCAITLAEDVLLNHPDSNFNICRKQALNLVTDGEPNKAVNSCRGDPDWDCTGTAGINTAVGKAGAEDARDHIITALTMMDDQDEFDAEFIGIPDGASEWLRTEIVWPEQGDGNGYYAPPFDKGGGWVRVVADADAFAETICEKFQIIVPTGACCDPATGICTDDVFEANCQEPLEWTEDVLCANLDPQCAPPTGACCDPATGICTDPVPEAECQAPLEWNEGELCAELEPLCAPPKGACCDPATGICEDDVIADECQAPLEWNEGESCAQVECEPNMTIDKDVVGVAPVGVAPGGTVQYIISVTNTGTANATGVAIWDTLGTWFTYASTDGISYTGGAGYSGAPADDFSDLSQPTWKTFTIPSGGSVTITFTADVDPNIPVGTYQNTAYADGRNFDEIDDLGPFGQDADTPPLADPEIDENVFVAEEPPPQVTGVPTLSQWGMIAMGILFAAFLIWTVRRRWVVSAGESQE